MKPIDIIEEIRLSFIGSVEVYTNGSCYKFYKILKSIFPNSEAWYSETRDHIVTNIDSVLYDITGYAEGQDYKPLCSYDAETIRQIIKVNYSIFNIRICPHCDEAINYIYDTQE